MKYKKRFLIDFDEPTIILTNYCEDGDNPSDGVIIKSFYHSGNETQYQNHQKVSLSDDEIIYLSIEQLKQLVDVIKEFIDDNDSK